MSEFRFEIGTTVMCNLGQSGWKPGKIIALNYREDHWPTEKVAPYQVALEEDQALIYVPEDDDRYCREVTPEDMRMAQCKDALAALGSEETKSTDEQLGCKEWTGHPGGTGYRSGNCHCCDNCPRNWSAAELYSVHYRCAERNGLKVTQHKIDLGTVHVGDSVHHPAWEDPLAKGGFMQCPTLVRLPPGIHFSDDGALTGKVGFDPNRDEFYKVRFVAVSTAYWDDASVGIIRLEINIVVAGNEPPDGFDVETFKQEQQRASTDARRILRDLYNTWDQWEYGELGNGETCDRMCASLGLLRELLERHPRLDGGIWWVQLGGLHMNVHKLLENALFECELYLGHALTFGDAEVRRLAEQNLEGCYQKRLLEAARFMWIDGVKLMNRGEWSVAAEILRLAAGKKDGWGWAVNCGDIWITESAARLIHGAELVARGGDSASEGERWIAEAERLLEQGTARADEARIFGPGGHPWASEIDDALVSYRSLQDSGTKMADWLKEIKSRTAYWCAQVLGGAPPFPPRLRPRREDSAALVQRLSNLK